MNSSFADIELLTPDPLKAGALSSADQGRWQGYIIDPENGCCRGDGEIAAAWVDPQVTNPEIRSRLTALVTVPLGAMFKISYAPRFTGMDLQARLRHGEVADGKYRDLSSLFQDRPALASELFRGVREWQTAGGVELCDFDRQKYNKMLVAVAPYVGSVASARELAQMPYIDHFIADPSLMTRWESEPVSDKKPTPWTYGDSENRDNYKAKHDPYNAFALELQDPATKPDRAQTILSQWFSIVDKQKANELNYDYSHGIDRIVNHAVTLAQDPAGDKARLAVVVSALLDRRERKNDVNDGSNSKWFSGGTAMEIEDSELRARLMRAIVLEKSDKGFVYPYKIRGEGDREAADWYETYIQANPLPDPEQLVAQELLKKGIWQFDTKAAQKAALVEQDKLRKSLARAMLYGEVQEPLFDFPKHI